MGDLPGRAAVRPVRGLRVRRPGRADHGSRVRGIDDDRRREREDTRAHADDAGEGARPWRKLTRPAWPAWRAWVPYLPRIRLPPSGTSNYQRPGRARCARRIAARPVKGSRTISGSSSSTRRRGKAMAEQDPLELALRNARRAAGLSVLCLAVMVGLFLVDGQRNRWLAARVAEMRQILDDFRTVAGGAAASAPLGGTPDIADGAGGDAGGGVGEPAAAGTGLDTPGANGTVEVSGSPGGRAGMAGGPRGNG